MQVRGKVALLVNSMRSKSIGSKKSWRLGCPSGTGYGSPRRQRTGSQRPREIVQRHWRCRGGRRPLQALTPGALVVETTAGDDAGPTVGIIMGSDSDWQTM